MKVEWLPQHLFRRVSDRAGGRAPAGLPEDKSAADDADPEPVIRCRHCLHTIARPADEIAVQGAYRHTFANPHGYVYEIGCFRWADGCSNIGPSSTEFSWFAGFAWRIAVCRKCRLHLGWHFDSGTQNSFHGLILERLIFPDG